ncbi:Kinase [Hexamita inflata]|uniref:CDC7 n=1 Tax=Hexamita inflata TaxID=28002 RepID=A0AA86PMI2_9EUKA|nr:CDC7 [Hexamita inflata]
MNNLQLEIIYWNLSSALEVAKYFNIQLLTQQTRKSNSTSHNCTKFINQEDEQLIKQGKVNADILEKIANENRARRLLLEDKYGGQKHRKMMRGWK